MGVADLNLPGVDRPGAAVKPTSAELRLLDSPVNRIGAHLVRVAVRVLEPQTGSERKRRLQAAGIGLHFSDRHQFVQTVILLVRNTLIFHACMIVQQRSDFKARPVKP